LAKALARKSTAELGVNKFERRRDSIVQAAIGPLNQHGIRGMTFAHVAAKLDVVPTAVGYYFRRKEDLAAACFLGGIHKLGQLGERALQYEGARPRLRAFVHEFFEFRRQVATGEAEEIAWFQDVRTIQDPTVNQAYIDMFRRVRTIFTTPDAGPLERVDRNARTHLILSQFYWAVHWLKQYNPEDYLRMADRVSDIFEGGMASASTAWKPLTFEPRSSWTDADSEVSREAFLRVATRLINDEGYLGASVQKICAQLGVTKGSFYHHNETKDDLVVQCFERTWKIMREIQAAVDEHTETGFYNLVAFASHLVSGQVSGQRILLRTSALSAVPQEMRPKLLAGFDRTSSRLASVVSDGIADGSIRPVDAQACAQVINGSINAASELHHWAPGVTPANATDIYLRPLFLGLLTGPHTP
jgi:AcrR family transcriptional regulator